MDIEETDTFDSDAVPESFFNVSRQDKTMRIDGEYEDKHLDLCCGEKLSNSKAILSSNPKSRVVAMDRIEPADIQKVAGKWPAEWQTRFTYVK